MGLGAHAPLGTYVHRYALSGPILFFFFNIGQFYMVYEADHVKYPRNYKSLPLLLFGPLTLVRMCL